jgi:IS30 family transposase
VEIIVTDEETNARLALLGAEYMRLLFLRIPAKFDVINPDPQDNRGSERADHQRFTLATDIKVYFCDPQNPWQRGSNENTNGLLRQYFPKGTDLSVHSQAKLNAVARQLNERPRKTLNFETPAQRFGRCVASIG